MNEITEFLDEHFNRFDVFPYQRIWSSYINEDDKGPMVELDTCHAGKDLAHFRIYYFGQDLPNKQIDKRQANLKIELSLMSYYEWEVFFEGYIDQLSHLQFILNSIGIIYR